MMPRPGSFGPRLLLVAPLVAVLAAQPARAQADLTWVIVIHVHSDPDSLPRSIDAIELAKLAKQRGMRALVLRGPGYRGAQKDGPASKVTYGLQPDGRYGRLRFFD